MARRGSLVFAWGSNAEGQLGDGSQVDRAFPARLSGLGPVTRLAAGNSHALALVSGSVWSWGANDTGQLGRGTLGDAAVPTPAATSIADASGVAAGYGFALALCSDGSVLAWGDNTYGQLGRDLGDVVSDERPTAVPGVANAVAVAAAGWTGYALLADGGVRAWGYGGLGELGDGLLHDGSAHPDSVDAPVTVDRPLP